MIFKYSAILIFFLTTGLNTSKAIENKILFKINNEIVTTIDIANEINYLKALNSKINQLEKNSIIEIAKNNLVRDKIKKIDLLKNISELTINSEYLEILLENTYKNIGLSNIDQFKEHLNYHNIKIEMIEEKLILDVNWKQYIYLKYKNQIKIDKSKITSEILNQKNKLFLLSEILFTINEEEKLDNKFKTIQESIKKNGFENSALIFSVSETSKKGGKLGWINSVSMSKKILNELSKININEYTKPIRVPGGFLVLKINNYKEENREIDFEKEMQKIINSKTNEQLNQLSNLYLNKLKKDFIINEL